MSRSDKNFSESDELVVPAMTRLYIDREKQVLYKFFPSGKRGAPSVPFVKYLQNYVNNRLCLSPAAREYRGNGTLKKIGIRVPDRVGVAFPVALRAPFNSVYVQAYVGNSITLERYLEMVKSPLERREVLGKVAADIGRIYHAGVFYRDLHFRNVLVEESGEILWVDTSVRRFLSRFGYTRRMKQRVGIFVRILRECTDVTEGEVVSFYENLPAALGTDAACSPGHLHKESEIANIPRFAAQECHAPKRLCLKP